MEVEKERETREFELARLKVETGLAEARAAGCVASPPTFHCMDVIARPKLPAFTYGKDIASYFVRFERVAKLLSISEAPTLFAWAASSASL